MATTSELSMSILKLSDEVLESVLLGSVTESVAKLRVSRRFRSIILGTLRTKKTSLQVPAHLKNALISHAIFDRMPLLRRLFFSGAPAVFEARVLGQELASLSFELVCFKYEGRVGQLAIQIAKYYVRQARTLNADYSAEGLEVDFPLTTARRIQARYGMNIHTKLLSPAAANDMEWCRRLELGNAEDVVEHWCPSVITVTCYGSFQRLRSLWSFPNLKEIECLQGWEHLADLSHYLPVSLRKITLRMLRLADRHLQTLAAVMARCEIQHIVLDMRFETSTQLHTALYLLCNTDRPSLRSLRLSSDFRMEVPRAWITVPPPSTNICRGLALLPWLTTLPALLRRFPKLREIRWTFPAGQYAHIGSPGYQQFQDLLEAISLNKKRMVFILEM